MVNNEKASQYGSLPTTFILDIPFSTLTFAETVDWCAQRIEAKEATHVVTANPEIVMMAQRNLPFRRILQEVEMVTPDGIGVVMAAKWRNQPIYERVTGYDLFQALLQVGETKGWSVFLLGASPDANAGAETKIKERFPGVRIVGRQHGYFPPEAEGRIVERIQEAKPDLLVVAMGAPRQEEWIARYREELPPMLMVGLGGSLDVMAGKVKRAPQWVQSIHMEWLYRLLKQPSRWKRMLDLPRFLYYAWKE